MSSMDARNEPKHEEHWTPGRVVPHPPFAREGRVRCNGELRRDGVAELTAFTPFGWRP